MLGFTSCGVCANIPESSSVLTSSGYPRLDEAALTFVTSKWRWYPPTLHCRPVEALTKIQIVWNQVDAAPPADDERMLLGREILDAMHFDEKLLPFLRALETSDRQAFIINSQSLPASQRVPALQAFDDASNEATSKSVKAQIERYSQYIAGHSPTPDLQAAAALLKTPIGQVMFNPDMQTPNNKQELGKAVLAHPQIMQVFASLFGAEAQGLQVAAQRRAEFKIDLDKRLCAKLLAVGIQDAGCSAYSTSPPQ